MKTLKSDALPTLPTQVKDLVRDGVYALYGLRQATPSGAVYVLITRAREMYLLSKLGDVMPAAPGADISQFPVENALTFESVGDFVRINHA